MPGENKWSFYNSIHGANYEVPFPLPVEKVEGFTYWPLMGTWEGTDEEQKMWETFLTPDITETSLEKIFTKPGETAIYQYHLVDGFRSRCKVIYHGKMLVRTRGKTRWLPSKEQLVRDPEYERDVERVRRKTGEDGKPSMEDIKRIIHCPPMANKPSILARNEPPFIPCSKCKKKTAEFCDTGLYLGLESLEDPDVRLAGHTAVFCSAPCARAWNIETNIDLPVGDLLEMENSPRAGMCRFSKNTLIKLHVIRSVNLLDRELWPGILATDSTQRMENTLMTRGLRGGTILSGPRRGGGSTGTTRGGGRTLSWEGSRSLGWRFLARLTIPRSTMIKTKATVFVLKDATQPANFL